MSEDVFKMLDEAPETKETVKVPYCEYKVMQLAEWKREKARANPLVFRTKCGCGEAPNGCAKFYRSE